jgi:hypothetical protein
MTIFSRNCIFEKITKTNIAIMKKSLFSFAIACFTFIAAHAQSSDQPFTLAVGLSPSLPLGDFGKGYSFGIGGQVQGEYKFSDQVSGVATTGYSVFFGKTQSQTVYTVDANGNLVATNVSAKNPNLGHIPFLVGARFYPTESFFIGAQIGYGILSGGGTTRSGFEYRPQVGYDTGVLQFILSYDGVSLGNYKGIPGTAMTYSQLGLTALYKFGGGSN